MTKSSLRPTAPGGADQLARVGEVRLQADQLLGDVEALGHQRRLLREAARLEAGLAAQRGQPLRRAGGRTARAAAPSPGAARAASSTQARPVRADVRRQRRALALPRGAQLGQRRLDRRAQRLPQRLALQHAPPVPAVMNAATVRRPTGSSIPSSCRSRSSAA